MTLNQILHQLQARKDDVDQAIRSLSMNEAGNDELIRHVRYHGSVSLYPSQVIAQGAFRVLSERGIPSGDVMQVIQAVADQLEGPAELQLVATPGEGV